MLLKIFFYINSLGNINNYFFSFIYIMADLTLFLKRKQLLSQNLNKSENN